MKIDKNKIAEFIYMIKLHDLKPFYDKFGITDETNVQDISFKDLPFHAEDEEDFDLDYLWPLQLHLKAALFPDFYGQSP